MVGYTAEELRMMREMEEFVRKMQCDMVEFREVDGETVAIILHGDGTEEPLDKSLYRTAIPFGWEPCPKLTPDEVK